MPPERRCLMILVVRVLLGIVLFFVGLDKWTPFATHPPQAEAAEAFRAAMADSGYFLRWVGFWECAVGALLILGRYVPLALAALAPLSLNFVAFHLFLDPRGLPPALLVAGLNLALAWAHRSHYEALFTPNATPEN